jgi:betaine-aldehyde dehydrogenase
METLKNFINGEFVPSTSTETTAIVNPSTGETYAVAPVSNAADVDAAMKAAAAAFLTWKQTTPAERQLALLKIADLMEANADLLV